MTTDPTSAFSIGLTGGIGCGKSSVGRALKALGLAHLDTDAVAREVVAVGSDGLRELVSEFGEIILSEDGTLDRSVLGSLVFQDELKRRRLGDLLHPRIWSKVLDFQEQCQKQGRDNVVEVPLLFENDRGRYFDQVWVVSTTPQLQRERLISRNGWTQSEIEARIASQMPLDDKVAAADVVIDNSGTLEELYSQVDNAWNARLKEVS